MYNSVMRVRWLTAVVLLLVWLLAACGGRTRRDYGSDSADAGSDSADAGSDSADAGSDSAHAGSDSADAGSDSAMGTCGDGIVTEPEECDDADPLGVSCADLGFDVGEVRCSSTCTYDGATCAYTFSQVSAGGSHTCGIMTDGSVTCWGNNQDGQANPPAGFCRHVFTDRGGRLLHLCAENRRLCRLLGRRHLRPGNSAGRHVLADQRG
jgi:predicted small secreted protein